MDQSMSSDPVLTMGTLGQQYTSAMNVVLNDSSLPGNFLSDTSTPYHGHNETVTRTNTGQQASMYLVPGSQQEAPTPRLSQLQVAGAAASQAADTAVSHIAATASHTAPVSAMTGPVSQPPNPHTQQHAPSSSAPAPALTALQEFTSMCQMNGLSRKTVDILTAHTLTC